jgi:hypothetical protein
MSEANGAMAPRQPWIKDVGAVMRLKNARTTTLSAMPKPKTRKAWVIYYEEPRGPFARERYLGAEPGEPLAVFPANVGVDTIRRVVDAFYQRINNHTLDTWDFARHQPRPYAAAEVHMNNAKRRMDVMAGHNPLIHAVRATVWLVSETETEPARIEWRGFDWYEPEGKD